MKKTILGMAAASLMGIVSFTGVSVASYTGIAVVASAAGMQDAEARRSSRSSRPAARPAPRPSPAPVQRATPAPTSVTKAAPAPTPARSSMIGSNVRPGGAATAAPMRRSALPPANRTFNSSPAQRASNGSMVQPFLMGMGGAIAGSLLANWLMSPSTAQAATPDTAASGAAPAATTAADTGGLNIVKPAASFKVFEGANIPAEFQEKMKANGVSVEPKQGQVTEYSKTVKVKGGMDVKVDVVDLPVLVVYENEAGKVAHDLYMPL